VRAQALRAAALLFTAAIAAGCAAGRPARQPAPSTSAARAGAAPLALDAVVALNPALGGSGYSLQPDGQGLSVYGRRGSAQIQLLVNAARAVVAVRAVFPANTGIQPWFDQARAVVSGAAAGAATSLGSAAGSAAGGRSSAGARGSASGGSTPMPAAPLNTAPPVRAEATPSATAAQAYTETIWLVPRSQAATGPTALPAYSALTGWNTALSRARVQARYAPGSGALWGQDGYGLLAAVDREGRLAGVVALFPITEGWEPFYDQLPGHQDLSPTRYYKSFTQHLWLEAPSTLR
jgi:hypothetical protein